jgi:hypothetical protein
MKEPLGGLVANEARMVVDEEEIADDGVRGV